MAYYVGKLIGGVRVPRKRGTEGKMVPVEHQWVDGGVQAEVTGVRRDRLRVIHGRPEVG